MVDGLDNCASMNAFIPRFSALYIFLSTSLTVEELSSVSTSSRITPPPRHG
jgi:hypothetical protein